MPGHRSIAPLLILIAAAIVASGQKAPGPAYDIAENNPIFSIKIDEFGQLGHCLYGAFR